MAGYQETINFYTSDFPHTLFPLNTNKVLIENFSYKLSEYIYQNITHGSEGTHTFLSQTKAYASKPKFHLRRTQKLDPVADFFLYDLIYRNRRQFSKSKTKNRTNFGYRFHSGAPISTTQSYMEFKEVVNEGLKNFRFYAKFDISSYFNSIYHHDLVMWFNDVASSEEDALFFDKFLRQTNSGRTVDCLAQGIYPAKMLGSHFLSFIDNANRLNSDILYRFMDDFYLFSNDMDVLISDFSEIQRMLGDKGLSINPSKTLLGKTSSLKRTRNLDDMKIKLLRVRQRGIIGSAVEDDDEDWLELGLDDEEIEYLFSLLKRENIEEEDAELVLSLMREKGNDILEYIPDLLVKFPNLIKNIFYFCEHVEDKNQLGTFVRNFIEQNAAATEYQLFWLAKLLEEQLINTPSTPNLISGLYEAQNATDISRAKILEIADKRFGLSDMREEELRTGASGWRSWSSAAGARVEKKSNRNHLLGYFANGSSMNELIADCIKEL